ncbi:hypothetical protein VTN77DRAFT_1550 [Rasamsonia byssochlamydoides]|uniref:uncharacterized protein n=1 Tax=Rasamsonia byssochlamydoides TaxID=89139 RepID=UPI0037433778
MRTHLSGSNLLGSLEITAKRICSSGFHVITYLTLHTSVTVPESYPCHSNIILDHPIDRERRSSPQE